LNHWIFVSSITGMPLAVQKCEFRPTICPGAGSWVQFVPKDADAWTLSELTRERDEARQIAAERDELLTRKDAEIDLWKGINKLGGDADRDLIARLVSERDSARAWARRWKAFVKWSFGRILFVERERDEARAEVVITDKLLASRNEVLDLFECPAHGKQCIPHALEEIARLRQVEKRIAKLEAVVAAARAFAATHPAYGGCITDHKAETTCDCGRPYWKPVNRDLEGACPCKEGGEG
jgi:hypothetical protein